MMTPQEVSEHAFSKASFGGYNMAMVDEFLDLLTEDYTTLYKENATLKAKMKVLVEKVEEYRSTEDAMRKALLTAQKMADEMVAEAEARKTELLSQAEAVAKSRMVQLQKAIADEQTRLAQAHASTVAYVGKLKELHQHEMDYLSSLSDLSAPEIPAADPVAEAANDITASVERLVTQAKADEVPAAEPEDDTRDLSQPASPAPEKAGGLYAQLMELNLNPAAAQGAAVHTAHVQEEHHAPHHTHEAAGHYAHPVQEQQDEEDDIDDAPTRRLDFSNLQFGKDYEIR